MASHSRRPLDQLLQLDQASPHFHDTISNILYGQEYRKWIREVHDDDVIVLIDYLDKARPYVHYFLLRSHDRIRFLMFSTLQVQLSGSVCEKLGTCVA